MVCIDCTNGFKGASIDCKMVNVATAKGIRELSPVYLLHPLFLYSHPFLCKDLLLPLSSQDSFTPFGVIFWLSFFQNLLLVTTWSHSHRTSFQQNAGIFPPICWHRFDVNGS